jgi:hypothetical protein
VRVGPADRAAATAVNRLEFVARRSAWVARRSLPRVARPLSLAWRAGAPERPVVILGCPRSGTSLLFAALSRSDELGSIHSEHHVLWEEFHHPRRHGWTSNALGAGDVTERERAYVHTAIAAFVRGRRFLDKTPKNTLRVPYLQELLPDAHYLFLRRGAAANVSSLIDGWRARPRYVSYRLPEPLEGLGPLSGDRWSFVLVPGWRELRRAPLEEICARQYVACNEAVLDARAGIDAARFTDVALEDLIARPAEELRRVCARIGLRFSEPLARYADALPHTPVNALTPPHPDKWRARNRELVERVLPLATPTERRLALAAGG